MLTNHEKQRKLHFDLANVGLRAQATAIGLVQLCIELRRAGVIDEPALDRIKSAIADEITVTTPRAVACDAQRRDVRARLNRLFAGEEAIGPADGLARQAAPH